jgi:hypothetical protein
MVGSVACMRKIRNVYKILVVENLKGRYRLGHVYFHRRILLRLVHVEWVLLPLGRVQCQTLLKAVKIFSFDGRLEIP